MNERPRLHARTDVGRTREHNEDNFFCDPALGVFAVADGMGGHAAGEVASSIAVEAVARALQRDRDFIEDFARGDKGVRPDDLKNLLGAAVNVANGEVFADAQTHPERRGMGTTLTALLLVGRRAFIAHVGDSRIYLVRGSEVRQLSEDHSVINELRRRGRLRPEILEKIQSKNAVTRAVGVFENVEVDTMQVLAAPGDRFVLCSDGLHRYLETEQSLGALIDGLGEEASTQRLIDFANECGGGDNITAVVVTLPDEDARERVVDELQRSYATLSALPFFRHLEPREIMALQAMARARDVGPGEMIVQEGARGESMYVILSGTCAVKKGDMEIARLGPGEHFGEMSLVERAPRLGQRRDRRRRAAARDPARRPLPHPARVEGHRDQAPVEHHHRARVAAARDLDAARRGARGARGRRPHGAPVPRGVPLGAAQGRRDGVSPAR